MRVCIPHLFKGNEPIEDFLEKRVAVGLTYLKSKSVEEVKAEVKKWRDAVGGEVSNVDEP